MTKNVWKTVEFIHDGDSYYAKILEDFRRASVSIQVEVYIFDHSAVTQMLLEEMAQAKQRGCEVQLVVDGFGSLNALDFIIRQCEQKKIDLRIYKPLFGGWGRMFRMWTPNLTRIGSMVKNLHRRNHRKIVLVDGQIAYVGSFNWAAVHSQTLSKAKAWRDTAVRLTGSEILTLQESFCEIWALAEQTTSLRTISKFIISHLMPYDPNVSPFRINFQPLHRRWIYRDMLHRIRKAEKQIQIVTAYFLPRRRLLKALETAAGRGVRIDIIVPFLTDVPLVKWAAEGAVERLSKMGVHMHEYQKTMLHAKYILIDDWASVGSLNFNHRSFMHDLEVMAVFTDSADIEALRLQFVRDLQNSKPWLDERRTWIERFVFRLAFRLRSLL